MYKTTFIGGLFAGVLHSEEPVPVDGAIHLMVLGDIPDLSKGDQRIEYSRGLYVFDKDAGAFRFDTGKQDAVNLFVARKTIAGDPVLPAALAEPDKSLAT